jgi:hypothetical protein
MLIADPAPPPLLEQALRGAPSLRLLDPSVDLQGVFTLSELKTFGCWPPWIVRDVDRDGRSDVVAVVVNNQSPHPSFGVIAVLAATPKLNHWVVPLDSVKIFGVAGAADSDAVTPLFCIECDANAWFRWSGSAFEAELYKVGETIALAYPFESRKVGLRANPVGSSEVIGEVVPCTRARVLEVGGSERRRWYLVKAMGYKGTRGWVPDSLVTDEKCISE